MSFAHDHMASNTTRSSESANINEVKTNAASFVETQIQISDDLWVKVADKARTTTEIHPFLAFSVAWILPANPSPLPVGEG
ncbi:hypothetical protein ACMYUL_03565 [Neisseria sp. CP9]|uniref:hypothetical protein n=1 Tax=unclassified Neisseria TaxID=2623750 RepID=UPI0031388110